MFGFCLVVVDDEAWLTLFGFVLWWLMTRIGSLCSVFVLWWLLMRLGSLHSASCVPFRLASWRYESQRGYDDNASVIHY
ncbi:MAG: hypothetical protein E7147_01625 [Rikenellaceae bacterium]|nr:hypothetical protein [Rikenellaceae bacterium]